MADVPAWATVAIAGFGFAGTITGALLARDSERRRLSQERLFHGADERLVALEQAIAVASAYRERVAMALRALADPPSDDGFFGEPLWRWGSHDTQVVKSHEAVLKLRCGIGPTTEAWEVLEWVLAESAEFCNSNRTCIEAPRERVSEAVIAGANSRRAETRKALEEFLLTATTAINGGSSK